MTAQEIDLIVEEAVPLLMGRKVVAFRDTGHQSFMFILEDAENNYPRILRLLVSIRPGMDRLHLTPTRSPKKSKVTQTEFSARMQDLLEGRKVEKFKRRPGDRVIKFVFSGQRDEEPLTVIAELIGRHANLLILDESGIILELYREFKGKNRSLIRGAEYAPPPPLNPTSSRDGPRPGAKPPAPRFAANTESHWPIAPINGAADRLFVKEEAAWEQECFRKRLHNQATQILKRIERSCDRWNAELEEAAKADRFKIHGDLLQSHFHLLKRGMDSIEVPDLFSATGGTLTIPLDDAKEPADNIAACYKRYKKLKDSVEPLNRRLSEATDTARTIRLLRERIAAAEDMEALEAMAKRHRLLPEKKARRETGRKKDPSTGLRKFTSSDNRVILVGKDGPTNARLTFQVARGNDMWLHCQNAAGSHVVIRQDGAEPPPLDSLVEAGLLAKHFSKMRAADKAEVIYTQRKNVNKIKGAQPGRVRVNRFKTLNIDNDAERLKKVLDSAAQSGRSGT